MKRLMASIMSIAIFAQIAQAQYAQVYGGPTYNPSTGGYIAPFPTLAGGSGTMKINDAGLAVGYEELFVGAKSQSWVPVAWGPSITAGSLQILGTGTNGLPYSGAYLLSNSGAALGYVEKYVGGQSKGEWAVRWDTLQSSPVELAVLSTGTNGVAVAIPRAINAGGTVVGFAGKSINGADDGFRPVRWDDGGTQITELGTFGTDPSGHAFDYANAVNDAATVVGSSEKYDDLGNFQGVVATRWDPGQTTPVALGNPFTSLNGNPSAGATGISPDGTIVGVATTKYDVHGIDSNQNAVRWAAGQTTPTALGGLGAGTDGFGNSAALAIAPNDVVMGFANKYSSAGTLIGTRAVRWNPDSTNAIELGIFSSKPDGESYTYPRAMNSSDAVVGDEDMYDALGNYLGPHAIYWAADSTTAIDLNSLVDPNSGWILKNAFSISDNGWIAGLGSYDPDGPGGQAPYDRLFSLQVPEPTSTVLHAIGLAFLLIGGRRLGIKMNTQRLHEIEP